MLTSERQDRQGSMLMLAILFATTLSLFSLTYFRVARETQSNDYRNEQGVIARKIARVAHDEAFSQLVMAGKNSKSQIFWFLLGAVSGVQSEIKLPFARQNASKLLPPGFACEFFCSARVVSFVNNGPDGKKYAGKHEGHGIIALTVETTITNEKNRRALPVTHRLELHHDYLVASMICSDEYGSKLKKVFLTRKDRSFYDQTIFSGDNATLIASQAEMLPHDTPPESLQLYNKFSLWARRNLTSDSLHRLKILDESTNTIRISGINHCDGTLDLNGPWQIKGQGVLIADSFTVNGSLTKTQSDDLLVLFARKGNIRVNTSEPVEAALIAANRSFSGTIESTSQLKLKGLIVADRINLNNWSSFEHKVVYDPVFANNEKAYQISFSPWILFRSSGVK